mmetsp:Transcript_50677/g.101218  ORF Transcript_50677/g.101218 Transcript_50677/m.101218 type:complete len:110 (-) Transcript_50677:10-339(-)
MAEIQTELAELNARLHELTERWREEKELLGRAKVLKEQLATANTEARDNLLGGHLVFDLKTSIQVSCIECGQCVQHPRCRATGHVDSGGGILRLTSCSQFSARNKDAML